MYPYMDDLLPSVYEHRRLLTSIYTYTNLSVYVQMEQVRRAMEAEADGEALFHRFLLVFFFFLLVYVYRLYVYERNRILT